MNVTVEAISSTVGKIYEAAYDQDRWQDVVFSLRDLLKGCRTCIVQFSPTVGRAISTIADHELNSSAMSAVVMRDPVGKLVTQVPVGQVFDYGKLRGKRVFRDGELWQDWFRPRDMHHGVGANLLTLAGSQWMLDIHRSASQGEFGSDEMRLLQGLVPHILRAGEIIQNRDRGMASSSLSSQFPFGMLVVDGDGRVIQMNEAAQALVTRQHAPLRLKDGHIQAANEPDTQRIQRLIATACSSENGAMPGMGGSLLMLAHGHTAATGLAISIAPFADSRLFGGDHLRRAAIMMNEVAPRNFEDFETGLRELFGLTRAEAKLAISLACGLSLKDSTDRTNLTVKTGRSYLERIFAKTGTRQQSELVAVLKTVQPLSGPRKQVGRLEQKMVHDDSPR